MYEPGFRDGPGVQGISVLAGDERHRHAGDDGGADAVAVHDLERRGEQA